MIDDTTINEETFEQEPIAIIQATNRQGKVKNARIILQDGISTRASCNNIVHKNITINIEGDISFNIRQIYRTSCPDDKISTLEKTVVVNHANCQYQGNLDVRNILNKNLDFKICNWHFIQKYSISPPQQGLE